jgi:hypothetical protein
MQLCRGNELLLLPCTRGKTQETSYTRSNVTLRLGLLG